MNKLVTSKVILLDAAKKIACDEGISKISIRRVAAMCGVSIGVIYNYFPTKADLVVAVIEDFWRTVFCHGTFVQQQGGFIDFFEQTYNQLFESLTSFKADWIQQLSMLNTQEKQLGRQSEAQYFHHVKNRMLHVLQHDQSIAATVWTADFTQENFIAFVFSNMMMLLKNDEQDCTFFKQVLFKLLHA